MPKYGNRTRENIANKANELARADDVSTAYLAAERAVKRGFPRRALVIGLAGFLGFAVPTNANAPAASTDRGE